MGGKKLKFVIGGLVVVAAIASLAFFAVRENMVYYYTVTELQDKGASTNVRVSGDLVSGTLVKGNVGEPIKFKIFDPADKNKVVFVTYTGAVPDTFKAGREVVVTGRLENGVFVAKRGSLVTLCPSKFQAKPGEGRKTAPQGTGSEQT